MNVSNGSNMKKIMFNDKYGLTEAVLSGVKTQTRRVMDEVLTLVVHDDNMKNILPEMGRYRTGEVVAIAQAYRDLKASRDFFTDAIFLNEYVSTAGWENKMFVMANKMQHHIRITNVKLKRLQDISDEDCLKEGILGFGMTDPMNPSIGIYKFSGANRLYSTPREAFAVLIDQTCGKGTWGKNPYVFVYDFKLEK